MKIKSPFMSIKKEIVEVIDKKNKNKFFLLKLNTTDDNNDKWIKITENEYNKIIRGN